MDRKFVITYKTSSVHSEDIYIKAKSAQAIATAIQDAMWFADAMNTKLMGRENVEEHKTAYNFKNNRFQVVIFGNVVLPGFESECVTRFGNRMPHYYTINWSKIDIYNFSEWFEMKSASCL